MTPEQRDALKQLMITLVPDDGTAVGNKSLREQFCEQASQQVQGVALSDADYWDIRNELIADGLLTKGMGKGGSVFLTDQGDEYEEDHGEEEQQDAVQYVNETQLYPPFYQTLGGYWVRENGIRDYIIENTSSQGARATGGTWTRPDMTLISVHKYPFLPGKTLDVTTFEIKALDIFDIKGVFETAAHSVFAHRCYLAVHVSESLRASQNTDFDRVRNECKRFDVGFLTFTDPADGDTFEIVVEAVRKEPDPGEVNEFITKQISNPNQMQLLEMLK